MGTKSIHTRVVEEIRDFIDLTYKSALDISHATPFEHLLAYEKWRQTTERRRQEHRVMTFLDSRDKFRWQVTDKTNSEIVGGSTQGYTDKRDCLANLYAMTGWEPDADD